jgi:Tol biopolymer transport system component
MFKTCGLILLLALAPSLPAAEPAKPGRILVQKDGKYLVLDLAGKQLDELTPKLGKRQVTVGAKTRELPYRDKFVVLLPEGKPLEVQFPEKKRLTDASVSPDGKYIAFIAPDFPIDLDRDFSYHRSVYVYVWDVKKAQGFLMEIIAQHLAWAPDGTLLAVEAASSKEILAGIFTHWEVDLKTKEKVELKMPEQTRLEAATPDGKAFISSIYDATEKKMHIASIDRTADQKVTRLTSHSVSFRTASQRVRVQLSPDGSRLLFFDTDPTEEIAKGIPHLYRLYTYDLKAKKREKLAEVPLNAFVTETAWAPDSKKVAYLWKRMEPGAAMSFAIDKNGKVVALDLFGKPVDPAKANEEAETHLSVADADGKNPKTILSGKARAAGIALVGLSWR